MSGGLLLAVLVQLLAPCGPFVPVALASRCLSLPLRLPCQARGRFQPPALALPPALPPTCAALAAEEAGEARAPAEEEIKDSLEALHAVGTFAQVGPAAERG